MIYEFDPVIYPYKLWVMVGENTSVIPGNFNDYSGEPIESIDKDTKRFLAFAMPVISKKNPKHGVIIFFRSKNDMSYGIVTHESSHAAKYLFEHIGADVREHEPFEYLIEWIANCCDNVRKGKDEEKRIWLTDK